MSLATPPRPEDRSRKIGRELIASVERLAREQERAERFLPRLVEACAASTWIDAAAVWLTEGEGRVRLAASASLPRMLLEPASEPAAAHRRLAAQAFQRRECFVARATFETESTSGATIDSSSETTIDAAELPTRIAFVPLTSDRHEGMLELHLAADVALQDSTLAAFVATGRAVDDWLKRTRIRQLQELDGWRGEEESLVRSLHAKLEIRTVATVLACEARRLLACDRASVTVSHGPKQKLISASGQDRIDPRAECGGRLEALARVVAESKRPFRWDGDAIELSEPLAEALDRYLEDVPARSLWILPLAKEEEPRHDDPLRSDDPVPGRVVGTLILERLQATAGSDSVLPRAERLARAGALALANAISHERLFLLPVWRTLGKTRELFRGKLLPKTLAAIGVAVVATLILSLVPIDFELWAEGQLQPARRQNLYAELPGTVKDLEIETGDVVASGETLLRLDDPELWIALERTTGELAATRERLRATEVALLKARQLSLDERRELSAERSILREQLATLESQAALYFDKAERLAVVSPIAGEIVTWQARQKLAGRPVSPGQLLLTVADANGPWQLELFLEERQSGHLLAAWNARPADESLPVRFLLASRPHESFRGTVASIQSAAELHPEEGNSVLVVVAIDDATREALGDPRAGQNVAARIDVGEAPIGYVWLHRGWEWALAYLWF